MYLLLGKRIVLLACCALLISAWFGVPSAAAQVFPDISVDAGSDSFQNQPPASSQPDQETNSDEKKLNQDNSPGQDTKTPLTTNEQKPGTADSGTSPANEPEQQANPSTQNNTTPTQNPADPQTPTQDQSPTTGLRLSEIPQDTSKPAPQPTPPPEPPQNNSQPNNSNTNPSPAPSIPQAPPETPQVFQPSQPSAPAETPPAQPATPSQESEKLALNFPLPQTNSPLVENAVKNLQLPSAPDPLPSTYLGSPYAYQGLNSRTTNLLNSIALILVLLGTQLLFNSPGLAKRPAFPANRTAAGRPYAFEHQLELARHSRLRKNSMEEPSFDRN